MWLRKVSCIMKMPKFKSWWVLLVFPDFLSSWCQQGAGFYSEIQRRFSFPSVHSRPHLYPTCSQRLKYFLLKSYKDLCALAPNNIYQVLPRVLTSKQITEQFTYSPFSVSRLFLSFHSSFAKQKLPGTWMEVKRCCGIAGRGTVI